MTEERLGKKSALHHFEELVGREPYPWQRRLYSRFVEGNFPGTLNIPTGLGKTSCVLLFLLARLERPALPRRVVYIVDRRAIVDQTARAIESWIDGIAFRPTLAAAFDEGSAFRCDRPVQLGVLRGGLADDGQWRTDPARAAVIVGTVDMIGSRMMFSGYGDGRSRRPMHAGLLGHDSVVMLDEAHLSPAMAALVRSIERIQADAGFRTMTLSATSAEAEGAFGLLPKDEADERIGRRLHAVKKPRFHRVSTNFAAVRQMCRAATRHRSGSVAVFARSVKTAVNIAAELTRMLGDGGSERVALLTGTLRGKERAELADGPVWKRFDPGRVRGGAGPSVYLVMTSAGEVGLDLDADHAVMDLATLDSMIQRLGRVNRMGLAAARISIVFTEKEASEPERSTKSRARRLDTARARTFGVLRQLRDLSPAALCAIEAGTLDECTVPSARPARLHEEVALAYAASCADLQLPDVSIYLRGVSEPDPPDCHLLWRREVADLVRLGEGAAREAIAFFRPGGNEIARVPAAFARDLIEAAHERQESDRLPMIAVGPRGDVTADVLESPSAIPSLNYATVFLPTVAGGLDSSGLPSLDAHGEVSDVGDDDGRVRYVEGKNGPEPAADDAVSARPDWLDRAVELRVPLHDSDEEDAVERFLVFSLRRPDAALQAGESDLTWLGGGRQTIDEHCSLVGDAARRIGEALGLPEAGRRDAGGRWHDRGKARRVWQRAAGVRVGEPPLAKSNKGRLRGELLGGYRHEFGSLAEAEREIPMGSPYRDLALHLVASHHGWARPGFPNPRQWDPDMPSELNRRLALDVADRFARLQSEYGPWRLAWLESLLKAADAHVSARAGT